MGVKVTLRGNRMYDFLDRLINVALPRQRDFRGISPDAFDGRGNYTLGLRERVWPELTTTRWSKCVAWNHHRHFGEDGRGRPSAAAVDGLHSLWPLERAASELAEGLWQRNQ